MVTGVETVLVDLVVLFTLAGAVAAFAATVVRVPYTIALVLVGLAVSLLGVEFRSGLTPELLGELILSVLVPALLFQGATRIDAARFVENLGTILVLAVVGLPVSVVLLGVAGTVVLGFALPVSLLFAAIVLPTDPVAVLPIFEEVGAPERLAVLVDCESMLNDGVAVVLYAAFLEVSLRAFESGVGPSTPTALGGLLLRLVIGIAVAMAGGVLVGALVGAVVYGVVAVVDDELTTVILSVVLAYGAFLLGETLGVSGVVAVVTAGLFIAEHRTYTTLSADSRLTFRVTWRSIAFVGNTVLFLTIGLVTPFDQLVRFALPIGAAIALVFAARAAVVYPLSELVNRSRLDSVPRPYQHVLVWSGIHVSIPLALVLGLPPAVPAPLAQRLRALVFGVATFTLVVQGLSMAPLLHYLGISTRE